MKTETTNNGERALNCFLDHKTKGWQYEAILIDTHLSNLSGLDVAKRIKTEKPDQKLVLVTTTSRECLSSDCLKTVGIRDNDILIMPFKMSN
jgi:CheY-like chemotaxis protein